MERQIYFHVHAVLKRRNVRTTWLCVTGWPRDYHDFDIQFSAWLEDSNLGPVIFCSNILSEWNGLLSGPAQFPSLGPFHRSIAFATDTIFGAPGSFTRDNLLLMVGCSTVATISILSIADQLLSGRIKRIIHANARSVTI